MPSAKHAICPKSAACWSPAIPAIGICLSVQNASFEVIAVELRYYQRTSGSRDARNFECKRQNFIVPLFCFDVEQIIVREALLNIGNVQFARPLS